MDMDIDITLFEPKGSDMQLDYPELGGYSELEDLSFREIRLCWFMGNRTSPIASYEPRKRLKAAVGMLYTKQSQNRPEAMEMAEGRIPDKIMKGIKRMAAFRPSVRLRAKLMDEYIFDQLQGLMFLEEADKFAMETDEKKKYADLVIKISSELPSLVTRMEAGYGIKVTEKADDATIKTDITKVRDRLRKNKN